MIEVVNFFEFCLIPWSIDAGVRFLEVKAVTNTEFMFKRSLKESNNKGLSFSKIGRRRFFFFFG